MYLPQDFVIRDQRPLLASWDSSLNTWRTDYITISAFDPVSRKIHLRIARLLPFSVIQPRALDFPYVKYVQPDTHHACFALSPSHIFQSPFSSIPIDHPPPHLLSFTLLLPPHPWTYLLSTCMMFLSLFATSSWSIGPAAPGIIRLRLQGSRFTVILDIRGHTASYVQQPIKFSLMTHDASPFPSSLSKAPSLALND